MLKLFGAVLIITAGGYWGIMKSGQLSGRAETLKRIISALTLLENEISYARCGIRDALLNSGRAAGAKVFLLAAEKMEKSDLKTAFSEAAEAQQGKLLKEDCEQLKLLAESLGATDLQTQIKCIEHIKCLLESAKSAADAEYKRSGGLYRSMGFLVASAAAVLLF